MGDYRTMDHEADVLKTANKAIANAYMLKTGMAQNELLSLMNKEAWFNAQDAVKNKFADEIMFDQDLKLAAGIRGAPLPPEVINKIKNLLLKEKPEGPRPPEQAAFLMPETGVIRQAPVEIYQAQIWINRRKANV
jgi:hypothetical protein